MIPNGVRLLRTPHHLFSGRGSPGHLDTAPDQELCEALVRSGPAYGYALGLPWGFRPGGTTGFPGALAPFPRESCGLQIAAAFAGLPTTTGKELSKCYPS
jgi:hypothetical protein